MFWIAKINDYAYDNQNVAGILIKAKEIKE